MSEDDRWKPSGAGNASGTKCPCLIRKRHSRSARMMPIRRCETAICARAAMSNGTAKMGPATVDVVIVNWNSGPQLRECLQSFAAVANDDVAARVTVIDNA